MNIEIIETRKHPCLGAILITHNTEKAKEYILKEGLDYYLFSGGSTNLLENVRVFDNFKYDSHLLGEEDFPYVAISLPAKEVLQTILEEVNNGS